MELQSQANIDTQIKGRNGSLVYDYRDVIAKEVEDYESKTISIEGGSVKELNLSNFTSLETLVLTGDTSFDISLFTDDNDEDRYLELDTKHLYFYFEQAEVPQQLKVKSLEEDLTLLYIVTGN